MFPDKSSTYRRPEGLLEENVYCHVVPSWKDPPGAVVCFVLSASSCSLVHGGHVSEQLQRAGQRIIKFCHE